MNLPRFNRTVRQLVALPLVLLVLMAGFLLMQIVAAARAQRALDYSDQVSTQVQQLLNLFIDQETGLRGFQLTGDPLMLAPWKAAAGPIQVQFASLRELVTGNPSQLAALHELDARYTRWLAFAQAVLAKDPAVMTDPHLNQHGKALMDGIRATVREMLQHEQDARSREYRRAQRLQERELYSLFISALIVGVVLAIFTRHHVKAISASYLRRIGEITDRSEKLRESHEWFQITLESIGDAVIACDTHGAITFMNPVAEKLTGWTLREAEGQPLQDVFRIIHEGTRQTAQNPVEKVLRLGHVIGLANHTVLISRGGREFLIDDSAAPIRNAAGEMIGVILVFRDVTEERQMQAALIASEKLAVAGRLAASIAHEIHNPLDSVANLHFLLAQEDDPEQRAEYLRLAQQELGRTMQISRTMLSLYREPKAPIQLNLQELIEGVLLLLDRRLQHQGIQIEANISTPLTVEGFPAELRQVFTNLIVNAIEAAGPRGRIRLRMERSEAAELQGAGAVIEIVDNGPGIAPENARRLFQPFFTTKGAAGTGLGLWVSMGIVQKHGGSITVTNCTEAEWPGACVRVFLPLRTLAQATKPAEGSLFRPTVYST